MTTSTIVSVGSCYLTTLGGAVVVSAERDDGIYAVKLWRQPRKSMASCATAFLNNAQFIRPLAAVTGMRVRTKGR